MIEPAEPLRDDSERAAADARAEQAGTPPVPGVATVAALRVVLIEDDDGDAFLVRELLDLAGGGYQMTWTRDLEGGLRELDGGADCVLLDLGLPDAAGLDAVRAVLDHPTGAAVVVLTGYADRSLGADAMLLGAQDYLIKGRVDHESLARAVRYAITRRQSQESSRQLGEAHLLRAESARMERGLVARPIIRNPRFSWAVRYEAGGRRALLGGDFFDAIELDDGTVRVVVGDICGHGADEAALGVALRVSWRALVLAGADPDTTLDAVQRVLRSERGSDETFATLCDLELDAGAEAARLRLAGHMSPLVVGQHDVLPVPAGGRGPLLGVFDEARWPATDVRLGTDWTMVVFTDGIVEGHDPDGTERFDAASLARVAAGAGPETAPRELADLLVAAAEEANGEPLKDDVALVILSADTTRAAAGDGDVTARGSAPGASG
jgi:serine phosphatase RsbU (regulator of sigma subunit)